MSKETITPREMAVILRHLQDSLVSKKYVSLAEVVSLLGTVTSALIELLEYVDVAIPDENAIRAAVFREDQK